MMTAASPVCFSLSKNRVQSRGCTTCESPISRKAGANMRSMTSVDIKFLSYRHSRSGPILCSERCIHFGHQQRNRFLKVAAVDPGKRPAKDTRAKSLCLYDENYFRVPCVQRVELMVVDHREPEERADPFPVARRIELGHLEHGLHAVGQMDDPG